MCAYLCEWSVYVGFTVYSIYFCFVCWCVRVFVAFFFILSVCLPLGFTCAPFSFSVYHGVKSKFAPFTFIRQ